MLKTLKNSVFEAFLYARLGIKKVGFFSMFWGCF
jgi:hypothetical protein